MLPKSFRKDKSYLRFYWMKYQCNIVAITTLLHPIFINLEHSYTGEGTAKPASELVPAHVICGLCILYRLSAVFGIAFVLLLQTV
jgi:hypothetical protein